MNINQLVMGNLVNKKPPVILSSSGGSKCMEYLKKYNFGKNQVHLSFWDKEFRNAFSQNIIKDLSKLGQVTTLPFKKDQSNELINNNFDTIVMHGGNTKTIQNEILKYNLYNTLKNMCQNILYLGWSAGVDIARWLKIIPDIPIKVHWNMFYDNKDFYQKNVHQHKTKRSSDELSTIDSIESNKSKLYYLLFDESVLIYNNGKFIEDGEMFIRKNGKWFYRDKNNKVQQQSPW